MDIQKNKNLIVAVVVAGVLLLFVMFSVLIYQLITISTAKKEKAELLDNISQMEQTINESEDELDLYQSNFWKEKLSRAFGYKYDNDR